MTLGTREDLGMHDVVHHISNRQRLKLRPHLEGGGGRPGSFSWLHISLYDSGLIFRIAYFFNFSTQDLQVASLYDLWFLSYDVFSSSCHDRVHINVRCYESVLLFFHMNDRSSYP